ESFAASSKAFKKTAEVAKKVVNTVTDTPIARAATTTLKVTANVLEQAARTTTKPIVESETYQQLSKDLSQAIHDASSRYGGVTTKEFRDLIKQRRLLDHVYASSNVTSMNLILHPSSSSTPSSSSSSSSSFSAYLSNASLLQQWKKVSEVLKMSDRLWISWPRWFFYSFQNIL
ncbi:hypothetical protein HMI56_005767, partial [Coelomomyces lativittatus]